ncbi:MAG TPA: hypothetical protein VKA09_15730 [Nitrososphaeraceae archaeon]|nr:hypothetical protein [Nitrososphaeraceae archaeon]
MISYNNNVGESSSSALLEEADELASIRSWTRSFALYIMFCQAMSVGDKIRAEACMNLSQKQGENSLVDPVFGRPQKENDKSAETKSQSASFE